MRPRGSEFDHDHGRVTPCTKIQPLEGTADVAVHGRRAQVQEEADLLAAEMLCDVAQDFALSRAQSFDPLPYV